MSEMYVGVKYAKKQEELVDSFKLALKNAADEVISKLYTDVTNYAETDAHINFHNYLRDEMRESFIKEISSEYGHYSWAHSIRMELLKNHREQLQNKIIEDLEAKVECLESNLHELRSRY